MASNVPFLTLLRKARMPFWHANKGRREQDMSKGVLENEEVRQLRRREEGKGKAAHRATSREYDAAKGGVQA